MYMLLCKTSTKWKQVVARNCRTRWITCEQPSFLYDLTSWIEAAVDQCNVTGKNEDDKTRPDPFSTRQAFFSGFSFLFRYHPLYQYVLPCGPGPKFLHKQSRKQALCIFQVLKVFLLNIARKGSETGRFDKKILTAWGSEKSGRSLNVRLKREAITHRWLIVWKVGIPYMII